MPQWLAAAIRQPTPGGAVGAPAVVLLDDVKQVVSADGSLRVVHRKASRLLTATGLKEAQARINYVVKTDKVLNSSMWLVRAGKLVEIPSNVKWTDSELADGATFYSEYRVKGVSCETLAFMGDVFAFEAEVNRRPLFSDGISFSSGLPAVRERFEITLPPGWNVESSATGPMAELLTKAETPLTWTWELRDTPYHPDEPAMPRWADENARIFYRIFPSDGTKGAAVFRSWRDVIAWNDKMAAPQCDSSPALVATVQKLTAGCADPLAKIRALGRHVQMLRYVGTSRGIGMGFGYRPRPASEVQAKGWGDCKDKANLLRAMLRETGIRSWMVGVRLYDGHLVREDWPSIGQFDHAILAIEVDDGVDAPAVAIAPGLGRLMFFDATNPYVLVGDLPTTLQGAKVEIVHLQSEALFTLPVTASETDRTTLRKVHLKLTAADTVEARCEWSARGNAGARLRALVRRHSETDLRREVLADLSEGVRGVALASVESADDLEGGRFNLTANYTASGFVQRLRGGLGTVRLELPRREEVPRLPDGKRQAPVELKDVMTDDTVELELPPSVKVDELPNRVVLKTPFGDYENTFEDKGSLVVSHRVFRLDRAVVPAEQYPRLRQFLAAVASADRAALVLRFTP